MREKFYLDALVLTVHLQHLVINIPLRDNKPIMLNNVEGAYT